MNRFNTEEVQEAVKSDIEVKTESITKNSGDAYIDYRKLNYKNTVPDSRVLVFLTGFCIGMVFFYLSKGQSAGTNGLLDREQLLLLQTFEVSRSGLLEYVIGLRLKQLIFCIICSLSSIGGLLAYSIMGWYGFETGLVIFSLVYRYGIKGIFLTLSIFLPHGALYVIVFLIIFSEHWLNDTICCHKKETKKIEKAKRVIIVFVLFSVGILCEIYINPEIIRKIAMLF